MASVRTLLLVLGGLATLAQAAEDAGVQEKAKAKLVSRLYQVTHGSSERCSQATPEAAQAFAHSLSRFETANAELMRLVLQSPHYRSAQQQFAAHARPDPARDTQDDLDAACRFYVSLMDGMVDTEPGRQAAREYVTTLSR